MGKIARIRNNKKTVIVNYKQPVPEVEGLRDAVITNPSNGDVLTYDGSKWVNSPGGG